MLLKDRAAIITGGARGMGRAIALQFAAEGASSCIADVRDKEGEETVKLVKAAGVGCMYVHTDVTDSASVSDMVAKAIAKYGKIDIMANCAGIGRPPMLINDISDEEYDRVVDVNMKGIFICLRTIAPHMKANKYGKIINIASLAGIEVARDNITCNAILPGMIRTDMTADFAPPTIKDLDEFMGKMAEGIPMKREGTVEDIAKTALYFASDLSSYVTGSALEVGGGMPHHGL
jgi:NAD(P)-dependent dehydrogenase (short-subunit alcohol dehydrogenase family)